MRATSASYSFGPELAEAFEAAVSHHSGKVNRGCYGCHLAVEGAFACAMRRWEWFVKEVLVDLMAGAETAHRNGSGTICRINFPTRQAARHELLRAMYSPTQARVTLRNSPGNYLLLHRPMMVSAIANFWLDGSPIARVFSGQAQDIERVLHLRHGVAHGTQHATLQAKAAMLSYEPLRVFGTVGEFLSARPSMGGAMWLEEIFGLLMAWAIEISP